MLEQQKEAIMQYMLMFYEPTHDFEQRNDPVKAKAYWAGWSAYVEALAQSGIVRSGSGLQPPVTATTLRLKGDKRDVQDGPFAETKEQLGGFFIIETDDLDTALSWAAKAPCASTGGVEVRPVMPPMA